MRTDSPQISAEAAQTAYEVIHTISVFNTPEKIAPYLKKNKRNLYNLDLETIRGLPDQAGPHRPEFLEHRCGRLPVLGQRILHQVPGVHGLVYVRGRG